MGSTALLDIISSMIIGGLLLLSALRMNDNATRNTFKSQENLTVQQNITAIVQNIQADFRRIGYCKDPKLTVDKTRYILYGRSDSIAFAGDLYNRGKLDTVSWWLGGTIPGPNPRIRMLCRKIGNGPVLEANLGVTEFSMMYFDVDNDTLDTVVGGSNPYASLVQLTIRVEPTAAYDTAYAENFAYWRQTRLVSRNMQLNR